MRLIPFSLALFLSAPLWSATISVVGDLRTDATFTACGDGCTLGPGNSDGDYAQWAAAVFPFTVSGAPTLSAITFSYGGGVNAKGQTIPEGGFEPYLSLFDSTGALVASTYSGVVCPPGALTNTLSGQCYDVLLDSIQLSPGSYSMAISAYFNMSFAENSGSGTLADGFTGLGNLLDGEDLHFAYEIILAPEPALAPLIAAGALLICLLVRRRAAA